MITVKDYEEHPDDADLTPYQKFQIAAMHQVLTHGYVVLQDDTADFEILIDYRDEPDQP